jgi:hypothetical protein
VGAFGGSLDAASGMLNVLTEPFGCVAGSQQTKRRGGRAGGEEEAKGWE